MYIYAILGHIRAPLHERNDMTMMYTQTHFKKMGMRAHYPPVM